MTRKSEVALKAAQTIQAYCQSIDKDCTGCIFNKHESDVWFKGCFLNDPDHLPETWELEKIKEVHKNADRDKDT